VINFNLEILGVDTADSAIATLQSDGIMGMSPKLSSSSAGELFVEKIYAAGIIGKNAFGVEYKKLPDVSTILLGGFDTTKVANESLFSWINLQSTSHWTVDLNNVLIGNTSIATVANLAILDTGTSLTLFRTDDFDKIYAKITEGKNCGYISGTSTRACE